MLCDPAPFGRGSEGLLMGQQARGHRSVLISIGDFHAQWRTPRCMSNSYEKSGANTLLGLKMTNDE